jgi:hypothetical protein
MGEFDGVPVCMQGSKYSIPLLWLASFGSQHVALQELQSVDSQGNFGTEEFPTLLARRGDALACYQARRAFLARCLSPAAQRALEWWQGYLETLPHAWVQVTLSEIAMMTNPEGFRATLGVLLRALDTKHPDDLAELFGQAGAEFDSTTRRVELDDVDFALVGYFCEVMS